MQTSSELAAEIQQQRFVMSDLEQQRFYLSEECRCLEATLVRRQLELQQADKLLHDTQADLKSVETKVRLTLTYILLYVFEMMRTAGDLTTV